MLCALDANYNSRMQSEETERKVCVLCIPARITLLFLQNPTKWIVSIDNKTILYLKRLKTSPVLMQNPIYMLS